MLDKPLQVQNAVQRPTIFRQFTVFLLTFMGYASFHACRQSFEDAKDPMNDQWKGFNKGFEGTMDGVFLLTYAVGLFNGGLMGDRFSASKVHSMGLFLMAIIYFIIGACIPIFNFNYKGFFIGLWVVNGFVQSVGWPTGVKLMANWFDGSHDGQIFGLWAANQCLGNIIGSGYDSLVSAMGWPIQYNFWIPAGQALIMAFLIFTFVPTYPPGMKPSANKDDPNKINDSDLGTVSHESFNGGNKNKSEGIGLLGALMLPNVITYGTTYACLKGVNYTLFFWLPYFLDSTFSDSKADGLSMWYNVGQIIGGWVCGIISDLFVKRSPTMMVFLILAVTPLFLLHIPTSSYLFVAILSGLAGFFIGGPSNIISSVMAAEVGKLEALKGNPSSLATVSGIIDGTGSIGAAACVYGVTFISKDLTFIVLTILIVLAALLLLPLTIKDIKYTIRKRGEPDYDDDDDDPKTTSIIGPSTDPSYTDYK